MSLITELSRRNVFRVGAAYLALGWVVTQVTSTVAPVLKLPDWTLPFLVWVGLIALPFVLAFAWAFELTPEGLKRERDVERSASITHLTARRLDFVIIGLLASALGLFAYDRFRPSRAAPAATLSAAATESASTGTAAAAPRPKVHDNSIAVLPFVNMSGDAANDYFSDGISEEILNVLSGTPELQVAARTSSFAYKGRSEDVPQIARDLNVRMVLDGSVRKQDDRVRITAQLIDAQTGFHLWSQAYDRKLSDIFEIQDEIARAIGQELKVRIDGAGAPGAPRRGTSNLDAYDAYLRGLARWQDRGTEDSIWNAVVLFDEAIALDAVFAQAYAGRALAYVVMPDYSNRISSAQAFLRAGDSAARALALDPTLAEPYAVLASLARAEGKTRATGIALYRRAIELRPSFATAYQWLAFELMLAGDPAAGLAAADRASSLDPRSGVVAQNRAVVLTAMGRYSDARTECERVRRLEPVNPVCELQAGFVALLEGELEAARRHLLRGVEIDYQASVPLINALVDALAGRGDRASVAHRLAVASTRDFVDPQSGNPFGYYETPALLVLLGEPGLALDYLERNVATEPVSPEWPYTVPALDPIRCDPRFVALIEKLKTTDARAAKVCADKT